MRQSDRDDGRHDDGLTSSELKEPRRLRRENHRLREEPENPKSAAVWFAREAGTVPGRASNSNRRTEPNLRQPRCSGCWVSPSATATRGKAVGVGVVPSATGTCSARSAPSTRDLGAHATSEKAGCVLLPPDAVAAILKRDRPDPGEQRSISHTVLWPESCTRIVLLPPQLDRLSIHVVVRQRRNEPWPQGMQTRRGQPQ